MPAPLSRDSRSKIGTKKNHCWDANMNSFCKGTYWCTLPHLPERFQLSSLQHRKSQSLVNFITTWHILTCYTDNSEKRVKPQSANCHQGLTTLGHVQWRTVEQTRLQVQQLISAESRTRASCCGCCRNVSSWATYVSHTLSAWSISADNETQWYIIDRYIEVLHANTFWMKPGWERRQPKNGCITSSINSAVVKLLSW